eukprot:SAG31_NODE_23300_length_507_cov_0.642157_1_plen_39_part_10
MEMRATVRRLSVAAAHIHDGDVGIGARTATPESTAGTTN